jgi:hypothetical protein
MLQNELDIALGIEDGRMGGAPVTDVHGAIGVSDVIAYQGNFVALPAINHAGKDALSRR